MSDSAKKKKRYASRFSRASMYPRGHEENVAWSWNDELEADDDDDDEDDMDLPVLVEYSDAAQQQQQQQHRKSSSSSMAAIGANHHHLPTKAAEAEAQGEDDPTGFRISHASDLHHHHDHLHHQHSFNNNGKTRKNRSRVITDAPDLSNFVRMRSTSDAFCDDYSGASSLENSSSGGANVKNNNSDDNNKRNAAAAAAIAERLAHLTTLDGDNVFSEEEIEEDDDEDEDEDGHGESVPPPPPEETTNIIAKAAKIAPSLAKAFRNQRKDLLNGETVVFSLPNALVSFAEGHMQEMSLDVSNFRIILQPKDGSVISIPTSTIRYAAKIGGRRMAGMFGKYCIDYEMRDLRSLRIFFDTDEFDSRRALFAVIVKVQWPAFSLSHRNPTYAQGDCVVPGAEGLRAAAMRTNQRGPVMESEEVIYNPRVALLQHYTEMAKRSNNFWRITQANNNYRICPTYPTVNLIPASISDDLLTQAARFRSRGRFPVAEYLHPRSHSALCRSSQPRVGLTTQRSAEDELVLQKILNTNPESHTLLIFDARPKVNAMANRAKGAGYELDANYPNCRVVFCGIPNIHVMREGFAKLVGACSEVRRPGGRQGIYHVTKLETSFWFVHIRNIMNAAQRICEEMEVQNNTVLVHCSDGWDRTPQLTALSQIILDPEFRTLRGFEMLIEKSWLSYGHKFKQRVGHGSINHSEEEVAPIFLQFLDCVWQLIQIFPSAFEFNEHFLVALMDAVNSCQFVNFLHNNDHERIWTSGGEMPSFWTYALKHESFFNSSYVLRKSPLWVTEWQPQLWRSYFLRWYGMPDSTQEEPDFISTLPQSDLPRSNCVIVIRYTKKSFSNPDPQFYGVIQWAFGQSEELLLVPSVTVNKGSKGKIEEFVVNVHTRGDPNAMYLGLEGKGINTNIHIECLLYRVEADPEQRTIRFNANKALESDNWIRCTRS